MHDDRFKRNIDLAHQMYSDLTAFQESDAPTGFCSNLLNILPGTKQPVVMLTGSGVDLYSYNNTDRLLQITSYSVFGSFTDPNSCIMKDFIIKKKVLF